MKIRPVDRKTLRETMKSVRRVALKVHPRKRDSAQADEVARWLTERGLEVVRLNPETENAVENVDLIVALGGDGTLLGAARLAGRCGAPILGVDFGARLGFLSSLKVESARPAFEAALDGDCVAESRPLLDAEVLLNGEAVERHVCLNDAVISKTRISRIVALRVEIGGEYFDELLGDGVIVSSATGSTAYSLSAGGPVIHPCLDVLVVTPICPHTISSRPLVIPGDETVEAWPVNDRDKVELTLDGQSVVDLPPDSRVRVRRSKTMVHFIFGETPNFYRKFRDKFYGR